LVLLVADMNCSCLCVLLVYATQRTANCVALAILIGRYQFVNDIRARRGDTCIRICTLQDRVPLQAVPYSSGWITSPPTRDGLSWHWISWRFLPLKPMLNDFTLCDDLIARKTEQY